MNPHYLWLTEGAELLTFFLIMPAVTAFIMYRVWRSRQSPNPKRYGTRCVAFGAVALLLFAFAKWVNADVRTPCICSDSPVYS